MESLLLRALESTLRHWLKSFSRDQFKLRGRSVQLNDLDVKGDVLHASIGLPPSLRVTEARIGKLVLKIPSLSNVNKEPIVVELDKLELVLTETLSSDPGPNPGPPSTSSSKSSGYGYADKLADGMTIRVLTVNLMLETRGGSSSSKGGAAWTPPLASITMRNLILYTTNEHWQVVPLNQAREFSHNRKAIYVFKKLEWQSLSVDLLPHPDMFKDERLMSPGLENSSLDNDGAKRLFFGGERFLDSISGAANITMKRTEQNIPLGLEVQLHVPEVLCPSMSEPGLRALLRFMTGVFVCMNRGDVDMKSTQSAEAAGRTMVGIRVDHIFFCVRDAGFQLELLLQSLQYVRASNSDEDYKRTMARLVLGCLFLRDTFSHPSCTLVQPSMRIPGPSISPPVPSFASDKLWPRIYPLETELMAKTEASPMLCMYSAQMAPAPAPPTLASQTAVQCQPLKINLQEESCIRIASFLSDGIVVEPGVVLPDTSLNAMYFSLKEFDLTVPVTTAVPEEDQDNGEEGFTGARLHVEGFMIAQSPFLNFKLLNLDKDAACFTMWKGQPVDSSQQRWVMRATHLSIALETGSCDDMAQNTTAADWAAGLWRCVEMYEPCMEAAMTTIDGRPLTTVPPPGGIVRLGISIKRYVSNTSSEQFLFVLRMYTYLGKVSESLLRVSKPVTWKQNQKEAHKLKDSPKNLKPVGSLAGLAELAPRDSAVLLSLDTLELKLLESVPGQLAIEGPPLVQILSWDIKFTATHQTLAAAAVISSNLCWRDVHVECVETELSCLEPIGSHYASPLTHLSGMRDSFSCSPPVSLYESPPTFSPDVNANGSLASLDKQSLHLNVSPMSGGKQEFGLREGLPRMRAVFWIGEERGSMMPTGGGARGKVPGAEQLPFLSVNVENVIPFIEQDANYHSLKVVVKVGGVRLGGGMAYNEALLHRFGVFGPDGEPGAEVKKVIKSLSRGSLANIFRPSPDMVGTTNKGISVSFLCSYALMSKAQILKPLFNPSSALLRCSSIFFVRSKVEDHCEIFRCEKGAPDSRAWEVGIPDDIELELQLLDWLFVLEGAGCVAETASTPLTKNHFGSREDRCWHSTFRCLSVKVQGTKESRSLLEMHGSTPSPVQSVIMRIEGLQALKPRLPSTSATETDSKARSNASGLVSEGRVFQDSTFGGSQAAHNQTNSAWSKDCEMMSTDSGMGQEVMIKESPLAANPSVTSKSGFDVEVRLVEREDDVDVDIGMGEWRVESFKAAVSEPVEVEATKQEVEHMVELFKSEIESVSRIAAGGLKLLQLHGTIGQNAIDQLSYFGSGGLDKVLTPDRERLSRRFSEGSVMSTPSYRWSRKEPVVAKLEASIAESEALCAKLNQHLSRLSDDNNTVAELNMLNMLTAQIQESQALLGVLKKEII